MKPFLSIFDVAAKTYAIIAAQTDHAITIIDISNPAQPKEVGSAVDGAGGFTTLRYPKAVDSVAVGEKWYAIVAADEEALDGVQLINISDPAKPKPAGVGADALAQGLCCLCQQSA